MAERTPDATVADLASHPGWALLRTRSIEARDRYMGNLAITLYNDPKSLNQPAIEYRRGFFRGIFWLLNNPVFEADALDRILEQQRVAETQEAIDDE